MMTSALAALHRGDVLILDDALGAGAAAHVLSETKHLLRTHQLLAETPRSFLPSVPEARKQIVNRSLLNCTVTCFIYGVCFIISKV